jgi:hypothetical protein
VLKEKTMRGLAERIALAKARVAAVIDPDSDAADAGAAYDAFGLGGSDYHAGEVSAPVMFRDEPLLLAAWEDGQRFAAELAEMADCAGCQDRDLPMCPYHG